MSETPARQKRKKPQVIPIHRAALQAAEAAARLIAADAVTHRLTISIGGERFAYDLTARITGLPPTAGDQTALVVPLKKRKGD